VRDEDDIERQRIASQSACPECPSAGPRAFRASCVEASWDPALAAAMAQRGMAVHEEAVVETLPADLATAAG
jgi:hypothetical protein